MDAELKERWIKALESGEYQKGTGGLRSDSDRFCCLGVLCNLHDPTLWERGVLLEGGEHKEGWKYLGGFGYIPDEWLPMSAQADLAWVNDHSEDWLSVINYIRQKL